MTVLLNSEDVSHEIREMPVSENVSTVSAIHEVREKMVRQQQRIGKSKNIVMDGRDIGTTVFPDATLKIFMTADPEIRALRRYHELKTKGVDVSLEEIRKNLLERDQQDTSRLESPLKKAEDAIILDNSSLDEEQQLDFVLKILAKMEILSM